MCLTLSEFPAEDSDEQQQESRHGEEDPRPQKPSRDLAQKRRCGAHQIQLWGKAETREVWERLVNASLTDLCTSLCYQNKSRQQRTNSQTHVRISAANGARSVLSASETCQYYTELGFYFFWETCLAMIGLYSSLEMRQSLKLKSDYQFSQSWKYGTSCKFWRFKMLFFVCIEMHEGS